MTNILNNSALAQWTITQGATAVLTINRESGTVIPDFTTLSWTGTIYTLSDSATVTTFTVTASSADVLSVTITAAATAALSWNGVDYGFNISGTLSSTVYTPIVGSLIVKRKHGA